MALIKLMLVDNNEVFKNGWRTLLQTQPEIEIVAETSSRVEAIDLLQTHQPDVVVIDISTVGTNEMETIRQLKACRPTADILALVRPETIDPKETSLFKCSRLARRVVSPARPLLKICSRPFVWFIAERVTSPFDSWLR